MAEAGPPRIPAFLSFSGGGAKGIAHVGAWYAVAYRDEFALRGVSGTSAGALIAALVAAGYRPGEVYDPADTRDGGPLMRTIRSFNEGRDGLRARFGRTVDALPDIFQLSDGPFVRRPMRWLLYGISLLLEGDTGARTPLLPRRDWHYVELFGQPVRLLFLLYFGIFAVLTLWAVPLVAVTAAAAAVLFDARPAAALASVAAFALLANVVNAVVLAIATLQETGRIGALAGRWGPLGRRWPRIGRAVTMIVLVVLASLPLVAPVLVPDAGARIVTFAVMGLVAIPAVVTVVLWLLRGFTRTDVLREIFRRLLAARIGDGVDDVLFRHFPGSGQVGPEGPPSLAVVAANITTQSLELFSPDLTPDVPVADALVASISLPVIFAPKRITFRRPGDESAREYRFLDGGLTSNLPAWAFDDDRAFHPESELIAFDIHSRNSETGDLVAAVRTAIFGSHSLNVRQIPRLFLYRLEPEIRLLEFDVSAERASAAINAAAAMVSGEIAARRTRRAVLEAALFDLVDHMKARQAAQSEAGGTVRGIVFGLRQQVLGPGAEGRSILRPLVVSDSARGDDTVELPIDISAGRETPSPVAEAWRVLEAGLLEARHPPDGGAAAPLSRLPVSFYADYRLELYRSSTESPRARTILERLPRGLVWSLACAVEDPLPREGVPKESFVFVVDGTEDLALSRDDQATIYRRLERALELARETLMGDC